MIRSAAAFRAHDRTASGAQSCRGSPDGRLTDAHPTTLRPHAILRERPRSRPGATCLPTGTAEA